MVVLALPSSSKVDPLVLAYPSSQCLKADLEHVSVTTIVRDPRLRSVIWVYPIGSKVRLDEPILNLDLINIF